MRRRAYWLAIAFIFTIPWDAAIHLGGLGRISRVIGLVVAAVWALSVILRGRVRRPGAFVKAYFVFLLWNGLTMFWSIVPRTTMNGFITYTQMFAMILMIWDLFETEGQVTQALQAFVLGAYISAASVIVNFVNTSNDTYLRRVNALGFQTDGIALIVAIAIPAAWYLATRPGHHRDPRWLTAVNLAYVPIALFAMTLTGTRGAALASLPSVLLVLWTLRRARPGRRFTAIVMITLGLLAVITFAPPRFVERITGSVGDLTGGDSLSGRTDIWADGLQTFYDNALIGIGLDGHRAASAFNKEAHNTPLSVLVETGVVGFALFALLVMVVVSRLLRLKGWEAAYWRTQLGVIALGSMSLSLEDSKPLWLFVTLAMVTVALADRQRARPVRGTGQLRPAPAQRSLQSNNPGSRHG